MFDRSNSNNSLITEITSYILNVPLVEPTLGGTLGTVLPL
jgi:hypothetical protein